MQDILRSIVHIGYHKTATTWFQTRVWPSVESHEHLDRHTIQHALLDPPGMHFDPARGAQILGLPSRTRPLILSEENLSGYIHNGGLHGLIGPEMARRIHTLLPDANIVVFIRNQLTAVRASYSQYVSGGGTFSLGRYLDTHERMYGALKRPYKAPAFEWEHFEYDRLLGYYDRLFGRDRVHVYPYELLVDAPAMLGRMENDLGIRFKAGASSARKANRSASVLAMHAIRFFNLFTRQSVVNKSWIIDLPGGHALRHAAKLLFRNLPGPPLSLPPKVLERVRMHYAPSNARLAAMRDWPIAELGYPMP